MYYQLEVVLLQHLKDLDGLGIIMGVTMEVMGGWMVTPLIAVRPSRGLWT
jgi:hypothetical protein